VFVAGDAAHVHTPAGGQGMNTGIQDAFNLTWRIALVLRADANPTLLDNYNEEHLARTNYWYHRLRVRDSACEGWRIRHHAHHRS
jgi:2-polyprenyl-6-methoxyphenol hydroxylase-like FAD-dependent oxidoreductase